MELPPRAGFVNFTSPSSSKDVCLLCNINTHANAKWKKYNPGLEMFLAEDSESFT
jgi:hypothetical protein